MAGDWIKVRTNLPHNPKVIGIARITGLDRWAVVGRLSDIWGWIGEHSSNGARVPLTDVDIDERVACEGFAAAMRTVGYLEGQNGGLDFPEWDKHNSMSSKARELEAEAKRLRRMDGQNGAPMSDNRRTNVGNMSDKRPANVGPEKRRGTEGGGSAGAGAPAGARDSKNGTTTTPLSAESSNPQAADVPFKAIVEAWAELCPELKPVRMRTPVRDEAIATFWQFCGRSMESVRAVFGRVGQSNLLNGRPHRTKSDRKPYKTHFDKVISPDLAARIVEGHFDDEPAT